MKLDDLIKNDLLERDSQNLDGEFTGVVMDVFKENFETFQFAIRKFSENRNRPGYDETAFTYISNLLFSKNIKRRDGKKLTDDDVNCYISRVRKMKGLTKKKLTSNIASVATPQKSSPVAGGQKGQTVDVVPTVSAMPVEAPKTAPVPANGNWLWMVKPIVPGSQDKLIKYTQRIPTSSLTYEDFLAKSAQYKQIYKNNNSEWSSLHEELWIYIHATYITGSVLGDVPYILNGIKKNPWACEKMSVKELWESLKFKRIHLKYFYDHEIR